MQLYFDKNKNQVRQYVRSKDLNKRKAEKEKTQNPKGPSTKTVFMLIHRCIFIAAIVDITTLIAVFTLRLR